ncbi:MAG: hypothetical protein IKI75_13030 [Lachnospiraceae bacterium]|nr:hypothetical protein [Lachnospiraceae bacterium]
MRRREEDYYEEEGRGSLLIRFYIIYALVLALVMVVVLAVLWMKLADYQKGVDESKRAVRDLPDGSNSIAGTGLGIMPEDAAAATTVSTAEEEAPAAVGNFSAEEELPAGMRLVCNGETLSPQGEGVSHFPYASMENKLENPVLWYDFSAEGLASEPALEYESDTAYVYSEEDGCYVLMAEDAPAELKDRAEEFLKAYLSYMMTGGQGRGEEGNPVRARLNRACGLTPSDSIANANLQKTYDGICYALVYTDQDPGLMETKGPIRWADNCVSVDISYHAWGTLNGQRTDYSGEDQLFRVFFLKRNGSWDIWAFNA